MATRRDLIYRMTADPEGFKKGMREAGQDSNQFWRELKKLEKQQQAVDEVMTQTGTALVGFGAAVGVGLGLAAKAAIDWESAWTGVAKVVEGSPEQLAALEDELRGLATTLPQTHAEIAGVAAAAGQLGIATEDIAGFTETMVNLGVATNLTAEDSAFALARMMNIMQTAPEDVERLGSAIVDLGNNSATTEAEIVEMALRIAGAGQQIGLSEADVLAYSAALSSVGVEAESGGTAISLAFKTIDSAVREGGDTLEGFARVAGMTGDEFRQAYERDAAGAIQTFVAGLGRMNQSGGDVFGTLDDLGLTGERLQDSLLRLSGAGDLLNDTLGTSKTAWEENSALMEEAARRYGTTEAQIQIARNQIVDLGISLGESLLPAINTFLDTASGFMSFFADLPDPVKQLIVVIGVAASAIALIGGAALIAVPKIHALNLALGDMGGRKAGMAQKALGGLTSFMTGPWGVAVGAAVTVLGIFAAKQAESRARTDELSATLDDQTSAVTGNTKAWIANELETSGALETAQSLGIDLSTLVDAIAGEQSALDELNGVLDEHKQTLELTGETVGSNVDGVETLSGEEAELARIIGELSGDLDTATESHERKAEATGESAGSSQEASAAEQVLSEQLGITAEAAGSAAEGFDDLDQKVRALIDSAFLLNGAQRDVEAGIDAVTEKLEENGATLDINNEKGRENEQVIEDQVGAISALALATAEETGSAEEANEVLAEQRERLEDVLREAGFTQEKIEEYTGALDAVPGEIETAVETSGLNSALSRVRSLGQAIHDVPSFKRVVIQYSQEGRNAPSGPQEFADGGIVGFADGGSITGFPHGGLFRGRGGPRSDSNIIAVSDGEFIVNAAATAQNRALLEAINSGRSLGAAMSRSAVQAPVSSGGSGEVRVSFDFSGVSDDFARAIRKTVRVEGGGDVQLAFGRS